MKSIILRKKNEKGQDATFEKKFSDLTIKKFTLKTGVKAGQARDGCTNKTMTTCTNASGGTV